jgi:hypothetical protein
VEILEIVLAGTLNAEDFGHSRVKLAGPGRSFNGAGLPS